MYRKPKGKKQKKGKELGKRNAISRYAKMITDRVIQQEYIYTSRVTRISFPTFSSSSS